DLGGVDPADLESLVAEQLDRLVVPLAPRRHDHHTRRIDHRCAVRLFHQLLLLSSIESSSKHGATQTHLFPAPSPPPSAVAPKPPPVVSSSHNWPRSINIVVPVYLVNLDIVTPYRVPDVGVRRSTVACDTSAAAAEPIPKDAEGVFS